MHRELIEKFILTNHFMPQLGTDLLLKVTCGTRLDCWMEGNGTKLK